MEYKTLRDGVRIPMLGLGTYKAGGREGERVVARAAELGYRLFDTAAMYGNEDAVGRGIRASGIKREDFFVVTKLSHKSYGRAEAAVAESLDRLGFGYIDLMLLHWPFGDYYAAWRVLESFKKKGVIKSIGVSNFDPARLIDLINYNELPPSVDQIETHLLCRRSAERKWMDKYGVAHMGYAPLGHGVKNSMLMLPEVRRAAAKYGVTEAQIALRCQVQSGVIVIPKTVREERLRENLDVFGFEIDKDDMESLAKLDKNEPFIGTPDAPEKAEAALLW